MGLYTHAQCKNYIYHSGVLGMRWGVRHTHDKYGALTKSGTKQSIALKQEYDKLSNIGTLSVKGKQRKVEVQQQYKKLTGKSVVPVKTSKVEDPKKKTLDSMSNEELQAYNTRRQLENNYLNAQPKPKYPHGKSIHEMSNEELRVYNERKALEQTYLGYQPKERISKGKQFVNYTMSKVVGPAATAAGKAYLTKTFMNKLGVKDTKKDDNTSTGNTKKKASKNQNSTSDIINEIMKSMK